MALKPLPCWRCLWVGLVERRRKVSARAESDARASAGSTLAAQLDTLHCVASLGSEHDLEQLTAWLLQGRSLLNNMRQVLSFGVFVSLLIELLLIGAERAGLPRPFSWLHLVWLLWVQTPLLALPLLLSYLDARNKKEMVPKNEGHVKGAARFATCLLGRAVVGAVGLVFLYAVLLGTAGRHAGAADGGGADGADGGADALAGAGGAPDPEAVRTAQAQLGLWLWLLLVLHSRGFAHRTLGGSAYRPLANGVWLAAAVITCGLQVCAAIVPLGPRALVHSLATTPWYAYVLGLGTLLCANLVDGMIKRHDRRDFERTNKRMYLEFTTKLGMHSPIEPGHRAPTSYLDE